MTPRSLRRYVVLGTLVLLGLASVLGIAPAAQAAGGYVNGTVTAADTGLGVAVGIEVWKPGDPGWMGYNTGSDPTGAYSLHLEPGTYYLRFHDLGITDVWYGQATTMEASTPLIVVEGETLSGCDAIVTGKPATLEGRAEDRAGLGIAGLTVDFLEPSTGAVMFTATTDASGVFTLQLAAGDDPRGSRAYKVRVTDPLVRYETIYWNQQFTFATASSFLAYPGNRQSLTLAMYPADQVTGHTWDRLGRALPGVRVEFLDATTGAVVRSTVSNANAFFVFNDLPLTDEFHSFKIRAVDPSGFYPDQFWSHKWTFASGDVLQLTRSTTVTGMRIEMDLPATNVVTGTVTGPVDGMVVPLEGIVVSLDPEDWTLETMTAVTAADGTYRIDGIPSGSHRLSFADPQGVFLGEGYDNKTPPYPPDALTFDYYDQTRVCDAVLARASRIQGTVTTARGVAPYATVWLYREQPDGSWLESWIMGADAGGWFEYSMLGAGRYKLGFGYAGSTAPVRFYGKSTTLERAKVITLSEGGTEVTGLDLTLPTSTRKRGG